MQTQTTQPKPFELGLYSFIDHMADPLTGQTQSAQQRLSEFLETIELADQVGLDVFGIGEHHRSDFIASSPAVILAAAAAKTKSIKLTSAVTVLSSDDPVRVFQDFATLDLLSNGRAEIIAGRGSFIESFPLFGYDLHDYNELFSEKLELLKKLRESEFITWSGKHRASLDNLGVYPRPVQETLPIWVAVGGTPESVVRAAKLNLPLALAIIGGMPEQFAPFTELYRNASTQAGHNAQPISVNSHGFIAKDSQEASNLFYPGYASMMGKIGRERGWPPSTREQFEASRTLRGANFVGTPDEIIEKILFQHEHFNHQRMLLMPGVGTLEHKKVMQAIELLGTEVAPIVRKEITSRSEQQVIA